MSSDPIVVRTFVNKFDAEMAASALQAGGIQSMIRADDAGGMRPGLWLSGVDLLVCQEDAERAAEILESNPEP